MDPQPEALLLLDDESLRAAVTWPAVGRSDEARDGWMEQGGMWFDFEQWRALAGLGVMAMDRRAQILFGSGLLGLDGSVDHTVILLARKDVLKRTNR